MTTERDRKRNVERRVTDVSVTIARDADGGNPRLVDPDSDADPDFLAAYADAQKLWLDERDDSLLIALGVKAPHGD